MKENNYKVIIKSSNNSNVINIARKISELVPNASWVKNTSNFLLKDDKTGHIHTTAKQVGGKNYSLDFEWDFDYIKGSTKWLNQYLSDFERNQLLIFLSVLPLAGYILISDMAAKVMPDLKNAQILIDSTFCIAVFVFLLFYFWYFNDDDKNSKVVWLNAFMGTFVVLPIARTVRHIMFS